MKAISIKQPWASLIAHGIKDIENRTWKTHFRGRVYIHASAKYDNRFKSGLKRPITPEQGKKMYENNFYLEDVISFSAIIGEVDIIDCVINHDSIWAEKTSFFAHTKVPIDKPIYNWVLANPVLYDKPIQDVKGKLSFWEPDIEIKECIGCNQKFNLALMVEDSAEEKYCNICADEMFPEMQNEYNEMVTKGEIEPNE